MKSGHPIFGKFEYQLNWIRMGNIAQKCIPRLSNDLQAA